MSNIEGLEELAKMEYPGRVIIVGSCDGDHYIIYGLTGRSESSQARRLKKDEKGTVYVEVTDQKQLEKGDPALLVYNVMATDGDTIIVSNGSQTDLIKDSLIAFRKAIGVEMPLQGVLPTAFCEPYEMRAKDSRMIDLTSYEPDKPNFTPRISAVVREDKAVLSIIKRDSDGFPIQQFYQFSLRSNNAKMIATYDGPNKDPLPSFAGEPRNVDLRSVLAAWDEKSIAESVYEALGEFRVSAACFTKYGLIHGNVEPDIEIVNKHKEDQNERAKAN
jgi:IMP cyclohydrolase